MYGYERYGNRAPTEREQELIALVAQGFKNREVAQIMGTTEHVIKNYLRVVYDKLGFGNRHRSNWRCGTRRDATSSSMAKDRETNVRPEIVARTQAAIAGR